MSTIGNVAVREAPAAEAIRRRINFIEGANVILTIADDPANHEIDVTIAVAAGAGAQDVFYPAPNPDDYKGTYASTLLADGVSTLVRQTFYLPNNYDTDWSVDVIVISNATGDLRWGISTNWGAVCANEDYQTDTGTIALGQTAVTADEIECLDITAALAGLAAALAGDLIGIEFTRDGGNILDDIDDEVHYIGIILRVPPEE